MFKDKKITCRDCAKDFVWTAGEQQFFQEKGFDRAPIRCLDCRKKKKQMHQKTNTPSEIQRFFQVKCKKCGKTSEVPFEPQSPNDLVCSDCFYAERKNGN